MIRGLFVTGTDTGAGKSVLTAAIVATLRASGIDACARKPLLTGVDDGDGEVWPADDALLGLAADTQREEITYLRFGPAVSPHLAAMLEGRSIDVAEILNRLRDDARGHDALIVEGVGGLLAPIGDGWDIRRLAGELGLPLVIAARPGLGTISHSLLTLEAARRAGLIVAAVVLTPWPERPSAVERSNRETIAARGDVEVAVLPEIVRPQPQLLEAAGAMLAPERWLAPSGVVRRGR